MPSLSEKFIAKVVDNQDPEQRGRIKVICPDFLGSDETPISSWIEPVHHWGWFTIPDVDEMVEIEIVMASTTDEHRGQSRIWDPDIRWRGRRFWGEIDEGDEATRPAPRPIPEDFKTNYGKRRGLITPAGHVLLFDDTEGDESVRLSWAQPTGEDSVDYAFVAFDKDGSIVLANKKGSTIYMDAKNGAVSIIDEHGNTHSTDAEGTKVIDKFGNMITMADGVINILSQGGVNISAANNVDVTCDKANINAASEVNLGDGADTPVLRGNDTKSEYDAHIHPTGTGPSGTTTPLSPATLSTKVNTE